MNKAGVFLMVNTILFIFIGYFHFLDNNFQRNNNLETFSYLPITLNNTLKKDLQLISYQGRGDERLVFSQKPVPQICKTGAKGEYFPVKAVDSQFMKEFESPCWLEESRSDVQNVYSENRLASCESYNFGMGNTQIPGLMDKNPRGILVKGPIDSCNTTECRLRCLPRVFIAGVAKCGTTDICHKLRDHPNVFGSMNEYYFWSQYRYRINGTLSDYSDIFDRFIKNLISLRGSDGHYPGLLIDCTSITFHDSTYWLEDPAQATLAEPAHITPHDIHSALPNSRFIVIFRNPTDRLYSFYNMFIHDGNATHFHERVLDQIDWWNECVAKLPVRRCLYGSPPEMPYVDMAVGHARTMFKGHNPKGLRIGLYVLYVKDWLDVYPREQFLFLRTEDWAKNSAFYLKSEIFPFLGLPDYELPQEEARKVFNKRVYKESMHDNTRKILDKFYEPYNKQLAEHFQDKKWLWK